MYRVVIKQLQFSFLSVLANISLSSRPQYSDFSFSLFPFSVSLVPSHLPLPVSRPPYFLSPQLSSFWTLSRCACGNFLGVIFAALLARSLTSLSSVFTPVVIFLSLLALLPCRRLSSPIKNGSFPIFPPFIFPSGLAFPRATSSDVVPRNSTSFHVRAFPFHFRFLLSHITSPGSFDPVEANAFFHGPEGKNN